MKGKGWIAGTMFWVQGIVEWVLLGLSSSMPPCVWVEFLHHMVPHILLNFTAAKGSIMVIEVISSYHYQLLLSTITWKLKWPQSCKVLSTLNFQWVNGSWKYSAPRRCKPYGPSSEIIYKFNGTACRHKIKQVCHTIFCRRRAYAFLTQYGGGVNIRDGWEKQDVWKDKKRQQSPWNFSWKTFFISQPELLNRAKQ